MLLPKVVIIFSLPSFRPASACHRKQLVLALANKKKKRRRRRGRKNHCILRGAFELCTKFIGQSCWADVSPGLARGAAAGGGQLAYFIISDDDDDVDAEGWPSSGCRIKPQNPKWCIQIKTESAAPSANERLDNALLASAGDTLQENLRQSRRY